MAKLLITLIVALILEAIGVVYLSAGLKEIGELQSASVSDVARIVRRGATNAKVLIGVLLETIFFVFLIVLLKGNDVSLIWPLTSLGFVLTALAARFVLHEQVTATRWAGVAFIVIGAALVSWSERSRPARNDPTKAGVSATQPAAE